MEGEDRPKRLAGIRLLSQLRPETLSDLERRCRWRRYAANEEILSRDSDSEDVLFVVEGRVRVVNYSITGREIAFATVEAGGYFGELAAIDGEPRSANVIALEDSRLGALAPMMFRNLLLDHPDIAMRVLKRLARIVRTCDDRIMDLSTLGAVQRVHVELLRLAEPDPATPGLWVIRSMPTHKDIASHASTARETVARVLSQLAGAGIVERNRKTLYIRNRPRLERLAETLNPEGQEGASR